MSSYVIGVSFGYHDSAAAIVRDGEIVAAAQEERFTRIRHDSGFPLNALRYCLREAGVTLADVSAIFYYENPVKKLGRIVSTYFSFGPRGFGSFISDMPDWLTDKVFVKRLVRRKLETGFGESARVPAVHYIDHHVSHASAAFFPGPLPDAAVLCVDGVGEWATTSAWVGERNTLHPVWEIRFPHSLGLLYSAMTYFCGFKVDSGEYKLMGLAPYGEPVYYDMILDNLIDLKPDGSFWLNMKYLDYAVGNCMVSDEFATLFGGPRRASESRITKREFDLAASVQRVLEEAMLRIGRTIRKQTGQRNLCLAGGVALNCVANGKLLKARVFDRIWVQPAAGDAGGALGAALAGWHMQMGHARTLGSTDRMKATLLGTSYSNAEIEVVLNGHGAVFERLSDEALPAHVAGLLAEGNVVGWFQGRMEFGPRALGARSILGDPRNQTMQSVMNLKIKNRESFRPFAPAVLEEHAKEWFSLDSASPYMLFVVDVQPTHRKPVSASQQALTGIDLLNCVRSSIPAVTHVDFSARVQTVGKDANPRFRQLLEAFHQQTNYPVLVNTSFNVRGEPIVETPSNAYLCFMRTQMDYLVLGNFVLRKADQPELVEEGDWRTEFALD
ncbi:carbamoyltransferase [Paraburkholderia sp. FT54]|uniref:carbamoyltransferase family protein n=1 Tax=Paraburkholderia sp. FT54 TaxID=3074437 RepID=UPI002877F2C5|nr:carbamoyltransferase [Paraburkholderia sp. FT54]WNC88116.1 carbamoyltransferase [Paraburkholderia sp. FT54]